VSLKFVSSFIFWSFHWYSSHNLFSSYLYLSHSHITVFIAGKLFVASFWRLLDKSFAMPIVRSASFQISKESKASKSFLVLSGILGSDKLTQVGICSHAGRIEFK
jgi:hypothetical protein